MSRHQINAERTGALPALLLLQSRAQLRLAQHRPQDALADARDAAACAAELGVSHAVFAGWRAEPIPHLERAVEMLANSPARLEHARALLALGAALRRANRRAEARVPLRRAFEQADRGGMLLLARRAREELNALGARPRRSALSGAGALTQAESRVAQLAARGHGNRAIAERLYVTQRTVETHLTHAFQKLDIRSRAELAAALEPLAAAAEPALAG